jgi:TP901 family phage tail tape measure protein
VSDPKIRYDILANAEGEEDVRRLADELSKLDDAVDPATAERAKALGQSLQELGKQQDAVKRFRELKVETEAARTALDLAQQATQKMGRELAATEKPTRVQAGQFEKLKDAVKAAKAELVTKTVAVGTARTELATLGISTDQLSGAEIKLRESLKGARTEVVELGKQAEAAQRVKELDAASGSATKTLGSMKLELAAAGAAVLGIQRVLGGAAEASAEFSKRMAEVSTLLDDTSNIDQLGESVRALTREFGGDAGAQASALYQIISAGATDAAQATEVLTTANKLAVGGVTDVKTAADGLTNILNAYGTAAGTSTQVSDALFVAMKAGKTTVGELSSSIGQVAPIAAQSGVKLEELLAATAALTKGGTSTSQSMTQLRAIITAVVKPTGDAAAVAQELGLKFDAQALKAKGLAGFLEDVRLKTGGNTETMAKLFGSVEALGGAIALTGNQAGSFGQILDGMAERAGATDTAFAKLADSPAQSAARFSAALRDVQLSLGQAVTSFEPLLRATTSALNAFNELPGPIKTTTVGIGAAAVALPALGIALGSITKAVGLARAAFIGKAAAATATVAPLLAAATGTAAMGTVAAAATPAITGAAVATTGLARAVTLLKRVTGVGLVLGLVEMGYELVRGKKAAEEADDAVTDLLRDRGTPGAVQAAEQTAAAVATVAAASDEAAVALAAQEAAARRAAEALGVDLVRSASSVSSSLELQLRRLDDLEGGLATLAKQGINTGTVVRDALSKMIEGARNQAELDALRKRIEELGKAGTISRDQLTSLMDTLRKKAEDAAKGVDKVADAYRQFGLSSKAELQAVADKNRQAWETIKNDATLSIGQKQQAFKQYADSAIAANGGVATSELKVEAAAQKVEIQVDKTGKATVKAMGEASAAVEKTAKKFNELGQEINEYGNVINQLAGNIGGKVDGVRTGGGKDNMLSTSGGTDFSTLGPGGGEVSYSVASQYTPPDDSGDWYFDTAAWQAAGGASAGFSDATARIFWKRMSIADEAARNAATGGPFGGTAGAPRPAPAPPPSPKSSGVGAQPASTAPERVVRVDLVVNGGRAIPVSTSPSLADQLVRELEESYRARGSF